MAAKSGRTIQFEKKTSLRSVLAMRETMLLLLFLAVNVMNISISPNYLNSYTLFTNINSFMVKGLIALPMAYILLLGEIDISVGSMVCLSATLLGVVYNATGSMGAAILAALAVGTLCGAFNGLVVTQFTELASMIVTLATMTLYRGISEMILGDKSTSGMRNVEWFANLYDGRVGHVPYLFLIFCVLAAGFGIVMHKTVFGRRMYAIGANRDSARYSGIQVQRIRMAVFTLTGLISGLAGVFYCAWMGTVKNSIAEGYEMEAICMCVLGGISTDGGRGNFPGVLIAIFTMGLLRYGLGLININSEIINIIIGFLLVLVVMLPELKRMFKV